MVRKAETRMTFLVVAHSTEPPPTAKIPAYETGAPVLRVQSSWAAADFSGPMRSKVARATARAATQRTRAFGRETVVAMVFLLKSS
jgi:hypothetical protein